MRSVTRNYDTHLFKARRSLPEFNAGGSADSKQKISAENARKVISRAVLSGEISSIKNVFPKRVQFVYLRDSYGSDEFWQILTDKLIESGSALGLALSALLARGGIIPKRDFGAASGSPVAMKKKLRSL